MPKPKPLNTAITIRLLLVLLFFSFHFYSNSQTLNWAFKAGGNSRDESTNIHIDNAGNVLMTGLFSGTVDFDPSAAVFNLTSAGSEDIFVAKYTSTGTFLWAFRIGGTDRDHGLGITTDPNNNVIVTGFFRGSNIDFDPSAATANLTSNGDAGGDPGYGGDIFVAKYTSAGNYLWAFNIGGSELYDSGIAVVTDGASNIYVGGYFKQTVDFDPSGGVSNLNSANGTIFLSKYSSAGNYQWAFNTGLGDNNNAIFDLKADNTGNIYVAGYFQGTNIDFDPSPAVNALSSNGAYEIFFAKYTTAGQYVFAKSIGGSGNDVARGIDIDNNGNIYLIGDFNGTNIDFDPGVGTALLNSNGAEDVFLAKFTNAGNYVWAFNFGSGASDIGWKVSTDNTHLFVTGGFTGTSDMNPSSVVDNLVSNGANDIFLGKYNLNGEYLCAFNLGGSSDDYGAAIRTASTNVFYLTGFFQGNNVDFDPTTSTFNMSSAGGNDVFLSKFTWPDNTPPAGTINGGTVCSGQQAQLTFNATAGTGPFTIVYNNGSTNVTVNNVQSGVPFNITPNPTVTTTYTLVSIRDASRCSETRMMNGVTATVVVSNCSLNCTYWPVFGVGNHTTPIPFSNTLTFSYSNNGSMLPNTAYSTMTPGNWFTPNPTIATTSPPNSSPHNTSDIGSITIYPTVVNNFGTISFAAPTTTGFYLHVYQTVSTLDFDHSFTIVSSDGDLHAGNSGSLTNNVLIPDIGPSQSPDDANATLYFPAGITQLKFTITSAPNPSVSNDGIKLAFTFPDNCLIPDTIIINDYTPVISLDPCKNIINVSDASAFKIGDTVLMIQMKGAVIDSTNTTSFGTITNYNNAGNYEYNYIKSKNGSSIELLNKIDWQYDLPNGKVQLVRVPYFQNYTVPNTSTLSCLPWNGSIGGVLVFNVQNNLTLNNNIDVSGRGFRGGTYNFNSNYVCDVDSFYLRLNNGSRGANKGEGIYLNNTLQAGRGKAANGGGGGNSTNAGGAGGSNGGAGGSGGKQYIGTLCNTNFSNGGIGGMNLQYVNPHKIYLGGGGGAGHGNEVNLGSGGNGGGIVIISANSITSNTFSIISNGATPVSVPISPNDDGRSGGGAGGTVLLNYQSLVGNLNVSAVGGKGDDCSISIAGALHGPGGGGGGGVVWYNKPTLPPGLIINASAGAGGVNVNQGNNSWGATGGTNGLAIPDLVLPITATLFKPNIDSVRIKDSSIGCSSFDFKGLAYTNTNPISSWQWYFGDGGTATTQNTSHTYSIAGTFTVKLVVTDANGCKDSIVTNVAASLCNVDIINNYTPLISLDPCKNIINVGDASAFNIGDTVLIIQMKGAVIDSTNSSSFGTVTNYKNAGNYEFNYVKAKNGNSIELLNKLERQYDLPNGKVQLIRVPYFQNYTIPNTSVLSCLPWNGTIGGVLVFNVQNDLTLNGNIDVSGKGFSGGKVINTNLNAANCFTNNYFYPNGTQIAATKGESIANISNNISSGKGSSASAGGGGNDHNSGGGGGGNATSGGFGGYQLYECNNTFFDNRGIGGRGLTYNTTSNKVFMGGGGGAGHCNNGFITPTENTNYNGGNGGGIVLISANTITGNNYNIFSRGDSAFERNSTGDETHDGMGGGGAGGTVLVSVNSYSNNLNIDVKGGKGGDMHASMAGGHIGPGGGGAGGVVWFKQASIPANVTINNPGGRGGYLLQDANNPYGTTPGSSGLNVFSLQVPIDNILFKPNIDSVRIKDSSTGCSSFDFKGLAYTNTNPIATWQWYFGDGGTAATQNTSHTYSTTGTFTVKLVVIDVNGCKDSIIKNVNTSIIDFDFSYSQNVCNPLSVQFFPAGTLLSNPYWSFGDGNISSAPAPIHVYNATGNYVVKYALTNGVCYDTIVKTISINVIQDDIILTPDTTICKGTTKKLRTAPSLKFCWTPSTYLDDANLREPTTSTPQAITYYYTAEVTGNNIIVNGNFNNGNTGFTSEYNYATPNVTEGQYYVGTNPQAWNASLSPCTDHTTGNGNMMLVNGSPTPAVNVWKQTVTVTPNTNYAFSTWIQALWPPNPAQLQFSINGKNIGAIINASLPTCTWTQFYTTWNSGNNTSAVISIVNINTQVQGNDFALDDISFAPVFIKRDSVRISVDSPFVRTNNDTTVCQGSTVQLNAIGSQTYSWSPSSGLSNNNIANPVATVTSSSQYIVSGTSAAGCVAKDTVLINVFAKPPITKSNDTSICRNTSVQLFASGGSSYSWAPSSTLSNSSIPNPVASPTANTTYYVTITDANTCSFTDSIKVSFRNVAQFSASSALSVCQNSSVQLTASGGDTYSWSPSSTLSNASISNPLASPLTSTNYSVTITASACNESTTLTVPVTVLPLPFVDATRSNDIDCIQTTARLQASGAASYKWTPAASLSNPNISNPKANPTATTLYTVEGTSSAGCKNTDTVSVKVDFSNKNGMFLVPSAFTPNNDGLNDCFGVKHWGAVDQLDFNIYNRWGQLIFHTTDINQCWDGKWQGREQDPAVFVYWIKAKSICGGDVFRKGTVVLIR